MMTKAYQPQKTINKPSIQQVQRTMLNLDI
jgi:hypothetical protein